MNPDDLILFHDKRPFRPFAIHLSDGRSLPVHHPEFLARSPDMNTLVYWHDGARIETVDSEHVTSLEQMPAQTSVRRKRK